MLNSQTTPEAIQEISVPDTMTLEEFLENDLEGYEYVKGELVPMPPATMIHGQISSKLHIRLGLHVEENRLGQLYIAETTFQLDDRAVKPDIAFVSTDRLPENREQASPVPPDLAVEVVSPSDKHYDVTEKALAYLRAGTRLVWVIEPVAKTVMVYRSETDFTVLNYEDTLTGEDVVEGFTCPVSQLFE
ncbi:MAG: Uma2 family endonuclease [Candidatus Poribacteria bacterium]|nr:Uma2 family endonuclease [Candidatus Poribacteria bacterium]